MNACIYKLHNGAKYGKQQLTPTDFQHLEGCYLDTLKISNIKESNPKKIFKVGAKNFPAIRWGKTVTLEMQDALGRINTLKHFFGVKSTEKYIYSTNSFAEPLAISGETKIIDLQGNVTTLYIFIPCLVPNSNITITQDAAGEFGVFDLGGELFPVLCKRSNDTEPHLEYYSVGTEPMITDDVTTDEGDVIKNKDNVYIYSLIMNEQLGDQSATTSAGEYLKSNDGAIVHSDIVTINE